MTARTEHGFRLVDSATKVFPDEAPPPLRTDLPRAVLAGETATFRLAWRPPATRDLRDLPRLRVLVEAGPGARVQTHRVGLVPQGPSTSHRAPTREATGLPSAICCRTR